MRLRHARVPEGTAIALSEAARKYGILKGNFRYWIRKGWVLVLKQPAFRGDGMLIDERTLQLRLYRYKPQVRERARTVDWQKVILDWLQHEDRTQTFLSQKAAMNPSDLNHLLTGRVKPTAHVFRKLERAMHIFLGGLQGVTEEDGGQQ